MNIAIIGGGLAGLTSAYYLQKMLDIDIDIYTDEKDIGGLAGTFPIEGTYLEKYYHHIFTHDKYYLDLAKELGVYDDILWIKSKVAYYRDGVIYPFTTPIDLLKFKPLSFVNRIRFGLSSIFMLLYKRIDLLEKISAEEFLKKIVGERVWEIIWKPMMKIKFGDNYRKIPAVWIWERVYQRFRSRKNVGNSEVLGYMKGSFRLFNEKLLEKVSQKRTKIYFNRRVTKINIKDNKCEDIEVDGVFRKYDMVLCTAALPVYLELLKDNLNKNLKELEKVKYDSCLIAIMTLSERLGDAYWMNVSDDKIPFGGLIEHTNLISEKEYNNKHLIYFSKYLSPDHEMMDMTEEQIENMYKHNLKKIYPKFKDEMVLDFKVFKDRYAQPIWPMNYSKIKPEYKTEFEGVYLANTAQIYPNDRGMNFSVKLGKEIAEKIIEELYTESEKIKIENKLCFED